MSASKRGAVLFDLDDTLYEYGPCNEAGLAAAHAVLDAVTPIEFEAFRAHHDHVRAELAERLRGQAASHNRAIFFKRMVERHTGRVAAVLVHGLFESYWQAFLGRMVPAEGVEEVLDELARDHALALVTNHTTDIQLRKIARLGLDRWFPVVVTSEEIGVEKPDARTFLAALEALGVEASRAVMVGDNPAVDVAGAAGAGLQAILTTEFRGESSSAASWTVRSIREVPAAVGELLGSSH